ncbi:MAG TPA: YbjN domain-containing protein [Alphaproteobacteria bacterium]|nr:YbjN domain-containing protein [Alphaproteobacteria bacterium]
MSRLGRNKRRPDTHSPLDVIEDYTVREGLSFQKRESHEAFTQIKGKWAEYRIGVLWRSVDGFLHISCPLDIKVPPTRRQDVMELIMLANEQICFGHFILCSESNIPIFRCSQALRGVPNIVMEQVEDIVRNIFRECERFYPTFQFVIWANYDPKKAMQMAILETAGQA